MRFVDVYPTMKRSSYLSKRSYEYFCTKYLRQHKCIHHDVDLSESFRRTAADQKLSFYCRQNEPVSTVELHGRFFQINPSLLNFLNWVATYDVDNYMLTNHEDIKRERALHDASERRKKENRGEVDELTSGFADLQIRHTTTPATGVKSIKTTTVPFTLPVRRKHKTQQASLSVEVNLPHPTRKSFQKSIS